MGVVEGMKELVGEKGRRRRQKSEDGEVTTGGCLDGRTMKEKYAMMRNGVRERM